MLETLRQSAAIFQRMTTKQRDAVINAYQNGYYDIPRKISLAELAQDAGISLSTLAEHLRKAEQKLMKQVLLIQV